MDLKISDSFSIPADDYANQGNSVIGIRGSGKTYTATKIAEQLIISGIPIIAIDPTGVWQNLRYGTKNKSGLPVVVAGGFTSDIELREDNIIQIVEAALKENVSLIIDLQEIGSKKSWVRIVTQAIRHLMENNRKYGLRHVFIEEAAEFCPQRLTPDLNVLYDQIERMGRMGRNYGIGYTLINQRPEEIAKAIFELSELVLVHRQSGKNSLKSMKDWLNYKGLDYKNIVETIPKLEDGQCWAISNKGEKLINILPKDTFHPDPKKGIDKTNTNINKDVSGFIKRMQEIIEVTDTNSTIVNKKENNSKEVNTLKLELKSIKDERDLLLTKNEFLQLKLNKISAVLNDNTIVESPKEKVFKEKPQIKTELPNFKPSVAPPKSNSSGTMRMLKAAAMFYPKPISKQRMAALAGLSFKSGSFGTYIATLKRNEHIIVNGNEITATREGIDYAGEFERLPTDWNTLLDMWKGIIGNNGASKILHFLAHTHPQEWSKQEVGKSADISHTSGSFGTYLATLKRLGLITVNGQMLKASDELFDN